MQHDQLYPMRHPMKEMKAQKEANFRSTLQVDQRNDESFSEYTYIDDDNDEPLLPEEESTIFSDSDAKLPKLLCLDQQKSHLIKSSLMVAKPLLR